jgi:chaperonin GroEL
MLLRPLHDRIIVQRLEESAQYWREALQNAASITSLLLTTEAVISQIPEPRQRGAMSAGGMAGGR